MSADKKKDEKDITKKRDLKNVLKRLRKERAEHIKAVRERTKGTSSLRREVKKGLEAGPQTVPVLAEVLGASTDDVLWQVMAMFKYGLVTEDEQDGDYFKYRLVDTKKKRK